jgi:hypothetical protein
VVEIGPPGNRGVSFFDFSNPDTKATSKKKEGPKILKGGVLLYACAHTRDPNVAAKYYKYTKRGM